MLDEQTIATINKLAFNLFFPVLLFHNIYRTDISAVIRPRVLITLFVVTTMLYIVSFFIIPLLEEDRAKQGSLIQGIYRGNFGLLGVPIGTSLLGADNLGLTGIIMAIFIPYYNILSVICFEICGSVKPKPLELCKRFFGNPFVISASLAIAVLLSGIQFPSAVRVCITGISNMITPLALIFLGAAFRFNRVRGYSRQLIIGVSGKLIFLPAIALPILINMGIRGADLVPALVLLAAPPSTVSYPMAVRMGGDGELAGQLVVFSSSLSIITMFLWIFAMRSAGFI